MTTLTSPLGKYAPLAALIISIGIIATALLIHVFVALGVAPSSDEFIDNLAFGAFGVVLGSVTAHTDAIQTAAAKINGMENKVNELAQATPGVEPLSA